MGISNPMMGGGMPNPFGGSNPFEQNPNPFGNMNSMSDFGGMSANPFGDNAGGDIDVDDLLKKIDAKIAELEEEERKEKEKEGISVQSNDKDSSSNEIEELEFDFDDKLDSIDSKLDSDIELFDMNSDISKEDGNKTFSDIISANSDSIKEVKNTNVTDDQFFDDFFQDEQ